MTTQPQDPTPEREATPAEGTPANPSKGPKLRGRPLGWKGSPPPESPSPEAATVAGPDASADYPGPSDEPSVSKPTRSGSSRTSSVDSPEHLEKAIRAGVLGGTQAAHELLVHDPIAQDLELLLADEEDAAGVAGPGARLVARRLTSGINNPDLADGIELLIAVGMYVQKQVSKVLAVRRARRQLGGPSLEDLAEQAGEPVAAS